MKIIELLFITMRPSRWWRIGIIFIPVILTSGAFNVVVLLKLLIALVIFCLLTGAINIIDDIADLERDKKDIVKRTLPIASGELSVNKAEFSVAMILVGAFVAAFFIGALFGAVCLVYFLVELSYYLFLKRLAVLDIMTVALETSVLLIGGSVASGKVPSSWLLVFVISAATLLSFCEQKRTIALSSDTSAVTYSDASYGEKTLDQLIGITAPFSLMIYSFFSLATLEGISYNLLYTVPFAIYFIYRIILLSGDKSSDLPLEKLLLKDRMLWIDILLWGVIALVLSSLPFAV